MSNYDLESQLSSLRSQISQVRSENAAIESELMALANSARSGSINLLNTSNNAHAAMENSSTTIDYSHNQLKRTFNVQLQIKEMYFIFKDVETANKKIRLLTNKLYFDYRNQSTVRKIMRGFIDNLDLNMVSDEVIYKSLEKEFLQSPNYWLGYVLLAIMNWKNNNQEKAEQCLQSALEKNNKSTSIFFMLFYLKLQRIDTAIKWFKYYQQFEQTGSDNSTFLMLVSSLPARISDEETKDQISQVFLEHIKKEFETDKAEINDEDIIKVIFNYFNHLDKVEPLKYNNLQSYVKEASTLANVLSKAKNNAEILKFIEDLNKVHVNEKNIYLIKYFDELISVPSEEEQVVLDEIKLNEEIIATMEPLKKMDEDTIMKSSDFKKLAKENHEKKIKHDLGKLNVVNEIINWVYINKNEDINSLTKWNLFSLTKDYTEKAYELYSNVYHNTMPRDYHIVIGDYTSVTKLDSIDSELAYKDNFIKTKTERLLKTVKDTKAKVSIGFGIALLLGFITLLVLGFVFNSKKPQLAVLFFILCAVCCLFGTVLLVKGLITKLVKNPKKRSQIKESMQKESEKLDEILRKIYEEIHMYFTEYQEADKISEYVKERIGQM